MNASLFTNFGAPEGEDPLAQLRRERESRKAFFFIQTVLKEGGIPGKQLADTLYFLLSKGAQEAAFPREWGGRGFHHSETPVDVRPDQPRSYDERYYRELGRGNAGARQ